MTSSPNIIVIIPARYASVRLPGKPLIDLCGKPMIQHVYERAQRASLVHDVIVATDDQRIVERVKKFNGKAVLTPSALSSGSDRTAYAAKTLPATDIVVNVQGDEPLIAPEMIDEAVTPLIEDKDIQVATLVTKITSSEELQNPGTVKTVLDSNGFAMYFSRSPIPYLRDGVELPAWHKHYTYFKHIGMYVFRKEFLLSFASWKESPLERMEKLEQLRILEHGYRIKATLTTHDTIPVDTAEDADRVRNILEKKSEIVL